MTDREPRSGRPAASGRPTHAGPEFFDVVRTMRTHRSFSSEPVEDDVVERVLEAATFAPSAENRQPWVFVVVRDPECRARIGELMRRAWEGGGRQHSAGRLDARLLADVEAGIAGGIARAPVLIVVCGDELRSPASVLPGSVFPASQNLLLAAHALGLGQALTTLATAATDELRTLLGLPAHIRPMAVIPLGHPDRALGPPRREPVAGHTHRDRYGIPW